MKQVMLVLTLILFSGFIQAAFCADPADVPRMTIEQLKAKLGDPNIAIIDVRSSHDWEESSVMIKGAAREDSRQLDSWIKKYPQNKMIVLYCK
jgi:rhodanese-related sulfurtransferase